MVYAGTHTPGETAGRTGVDLNYGAAKDLQLSLSLPIAYDTAASPRYGVGDVAVSAKYRLLQQAEGSWTPDVAVFPEIDLPTATDSFGNGRASLFLPAWAQKDFGGWSVFGGGGLRINSAPDRRNSWLFGAAVTRQVAGPLQLGVELYRQTADTPGETGATNLGFGMIYRFNPRFALVASGGPRLNAPAGEASTSFFAALEINY